MITDEICEWLQARRVEAWESHYTATDAYKRHIADPEHDRSRAMELAREFDRTKAEALFIGTLWTVRVDELNEAQVSS